MSKYLPFNTSGAMGEYPIPDEVHNKIGAILHNWLASEGIAVENNTMTLYVEGHCYAKEAKGE